MHTSVGVLALWMLAQPPASVQEPSWQSDYQASRKACLKQQKPLAVFVGEGQGGREKLTQEGPLNETTRKVLKDSYVCVYLDSSDARHRDLLEALAITKGTGLVVSDRTGDYQAFHHDGAIAQAELTKQLQ